MRKWVLWLGCSSLVAIAAWGLPAKANAEKLLQKPLYQADVQIDPVKKK